MAFIATTPFAVLDYRTFLADLSFQFAHQLGTVEHIGVVLPGSPFGHSSPPPCRRSPAYPSSCWRSRSSS